jgi:hypothetical protein
MQRKIKQAAYYGVAVGFGMAATVVATEIICSLRNMINGRR